MNIEMKRKELREEFIRNYKEGSCCPEYADMNYVNHIETELIKARYLIKTAIKLMQEFKGDERVYELLVHGIS